MRVNDIEIQRIRELSQKKYYYFFKIFWSELVSEPLADNWHIKKLCDKLEVVGRQVIERRPLEKNLLINISPGETKSTISTIMFPVWLWVMDPTIRLITASHSQDLAIKHAETSRDLIGSDLFQACFGDLFQIVKGKDQKKRYANDQGGERIIASVGSNVTGKHAHCIIVDDPLDHQEAQSEVKRETAKNWCTKTINTRKVSQTLTPTILIMQRLHEEDPTAVLAKSWGKAGTLDHVRLPADNRYQISPPEWEEFYTFDTDRKVMNPDRKPTKVIRSMEEEMTATEAAGQLGQSPQPAEGNKLKKHWFSQRFDLHKLEEKALLYGWPLAWNATLDGAYTKETKNSATGVLIWTAFQNQLYLRNYKQFWLEFPELLNELPYFCMANGFTKYSTMHVEPKAIGKSLVQVLGRQPGMNVIEDELPQGVSKMQGKEMRVDSIAPFVRGMNVFLMEGTNWEPFVSQCATFPNASHSDLVDCLCMAIGKVPERGIYEGIDGLI